MEDFCRVDVHQASEHLVEEELKVLVCHCALVHLDHIVKVRLHQLKDNVNVLIVA